MNESKPFIYDQLDRDLIAILRNDGRAPVSFLAKKLQVSRGTVQNRIDRLLENGAILGFTIRAHEAVDPDKIRAVMMIEVVGRNTSKVIRQLQGIPQLQQLHTTNGKWDLVADIKTASLLEFDQVLKIIREIEGVLSSETSLLLNTI